MIFEFLHHLRVLQPFQPAKAKGYALCVVAPQPPEQRIFGFLDHFGGCSEFRQQRTVYLVENDYVLAAQLHSEGVPFTIGGS